MFSQKTMPATLQLRHFLRQGFKPNRHKHLFYKSIKILSESMYTISTHHLWLGLPQLSRALHRSHLPLLPVSSFGLALRKWVHHHHLLTFSGSTEMLHPPHSTQSFPAQNVLHDLSSSTFWRQGTRTTYAPRNCALILQISSLCYFPHDSTML